MVECYGFMLVVFVSICLSDQADKCVRNLWTIQCISLRFIPQTLKLTDLCELYFCVENLDLCVRNLSHKGTLYWSRHRNVHPSIRNPSIWPYFHLWTLTRVIIKGFSPNLVYALIWWESGFGLLKGNFFLSFDRVIHPPHNVGRIIWI